MRAPNLAARGSHPTWAVHPVRPPPVPSSRPSSVVSSKLQPLTVACQLTTYEIARVEQSYANVCRVRNALARARAHLCVCVRVCTRAVCIPAQKTRGGETGFFPVFRLRRASRTGRNTTVDSCWIDRSLPISEREGEEKEREREGTLLIREIVRIIYQRISPVRRGSSHYRFRRFALGSK